MADLDHTSDESSVDSRGESNSQDSKLEFSEDEETLITRMFNLSLPYNRVMPLVGFIVSISKDSGYPN
ncbi:hypothetical protein SO802_015509 [Lithocarpus litseifolius]|uniref:Uncharacterized protein n=1 Tax=Lithocarpus litseifolius TaxID=425828 RepID=A0AAW2CTW2_9ROSI